MASLGWLRVVGLVVVGAPVMVTAIAVRLTVTNSPNDSTSPCTAGVQVRFYPSLSTHSFFPSSVVGQSATLTYQLATRPTGVAFERIDGDDGWGISEVVAKVGNEDEITLFSGYGFPLWLDFNTPVYDEVVGDDVFFKIPSVDAAIPVSTSLAISVTTADEDNCDSQNVHVYVSNNHGASMAASKQLFQTTNRGSTETATFTNLNFVPTGLKLVSTSTDGFCLSNIKVQIDGCDDPGDGRTIVQSRVVRLDSEQVWHSMTVPSSAYFAISFDDADNDGVCDGMDPCPEDGDNDADSDGICGAEDSCPQDSSNDADGDSICDDVDPCLGDATNADADGDSICDDVDSCPGDRSNDMDDDGICGAVDSCPEDPSNDADGDSICDDVDSCPDDATNNCCVSSADFEDACRVSPQSTYCVVGDTKSGHPCLPGASKLGRGIDLTNPGDLKLPVKLLAFDTRSPETIDIAGTTYERPVDLDVESVPTDSSSTSSSSFKSIEEFTSSWDASASGSYTGVVSVSASAGAAEDVATALHNNRVWMQK